MHEDFIAALPRNRLQATPITEIGGSTDDVTGLFTLAIPASALFVTKITDPHGNSTEFVEFQVTFAALEKFRESINRRLPDLVRIHAIKKIRALEEQLAFLKNDPEAMTTNFKEFNDDGEIPQATDAPKTGSGAGAP